MGIEISLAFVNQTRPLVHPISATLAPFFDTVAAGDVLGTAVEPGIFVSTAGPVISAIIGVDVNGINEPLGLDYVAAHGDLVFIYIDVADSLANTKTYDLGTQTIAYAPPQVIGTGLADELNLQDGVAVPAKNITAAFAGSGLTIALVGGMLPTGQAFDGTSVTGTPTALGTGLVTFSATNDSGITVYSDYIWAVASATPAVPDPFNTSQWTISAVAAGGALDITLTALPADNGAIINLIQYRADGGPWFSSGITGAGIFQVLGLTNGVSASIELRAINSAGPSAVSDLKSAVPADTVPPVLSALAIDETAKTITIAHDEPVDLLWVRYAASQTWAGANDQTKGATLAAALATAPDSGIISVPAVGTYSINFAGLVAGTYFVSYVKKDLAGNYSAILQGPASFPDTTSGGT